ALDVRDKGLGTVDDPSISVTHRSGPDACEIRPGVGLGKGIATMLLTFDDRKEEPLLLLIVAEIERRLGAAAEFEHRGMLEQLLVDETHRELADVVSAIFGRHFERPETRLAPLALQPVANLDIEFALDQEFLLKRHQLLLAELADAVDHHAMLFGNGEIHRLLPTGCVSNIERGDRFLASGIALSKTRKFAILKAARGRAGLSKNGRSKMTESR